MKKLNLLLLAIALTFSSCATAQELSLENYLLNYDYESRTDMKIRSKA